MKTIKIKKINVIENQDVYDITTEKNHNFFANGLLVHNCVEIGLNPYLPTGESGFQMCNLTEINGAAIKTLNDFEVAVRAATIIGTCQAGFTSFEYLGRVTEEICKREALLGVSITGVMDSPEVLMNAEHLQSMAKLAIVVNADIAKKIGINPASRITTIKPSGSTSLLLNTASGIHHRFGRKYFRRIQANKNDNVYQHFKKMNPHACEESVWSVNKTDDVITFCVKTPDDCIIRDDLTAIEFLEAVKLFQQNWVLPGTADPSTSPGLNHNVSNTVTVKPSEWEAVADFIWENKQFFTGVSLLADNGTTIYQQAPHEIIRTSDDEMSWSNLTESFQNVDYLQLNEDEDKTSLKQTVACAGGACDVTLEI